MDADRLSCTSQSSTTATDLASRTVRITLAAGDTVTCTFTNRLTPPAGALILRKVTADGAGTFPFTVRGANGRVSARPRLTTRSAGGVGAVSALELAPGRYRISERLPVSPAGEWRQERVTCDGRLVAGGEPVRVEIAADRGAACTFTNRLDFVGAIDVAGSLSAGSDPPGTSHRRGVMSRPSAASSRRPTGRACPRRRAGSRPAVCRSAAT